MKANEFVKKYGIDHTKLHIENMEAVQIGNNHQDYIDDLKSLVESHELVEKHGGLIESKIYVECCDDADLSKAIADVESCQ